MQATDQWVGVRNARIVLIDSEGARARVASRLNKLCCDVYGLEAGIHADLAALVTAQPELPSLTQVSAAALNRLRAGRCTIFDLRSSMSFRKAHIPGSHSSSRSRLSSDLRDAQGLVFLVADDQ